MEIYQQSLNLEIRCGGASVAIKQNFQQDRLACSNRENRITDKSCKNVRVGLNTAIELEKIMSVAWLTK